MPTSYSNAVNIESAEQITFNGKYAYKFILSGAIDSDLEENSDFNAKAKIIIFADKNYQYRITYYAIPKDYDELYEEENS